MNFSGCLGVHCDRKNGTFDKLHQTSQKFHFKAQNEAIKYLKKKAKNTHFSPKFAIFFILRPYPKVSGDEKRNIVFSR